jgi:hypothetical protein
VDKSGSYKLSFFLIGAGISFSGILIALILCYDKIKKEKNEKKKKLNGVENGDLPAVEAAAELTNQSNKSHQLKKD